MLDARQLAGQLLRGEARQHGRWHRAIDLRSLALEGHARPFDGTDPRRLCFGVDPRPFRLRLAADPLRLCLLGGLAARVLSALVDELLLPSRQLDLVLHLVFLDGPFLLDGLGPAPEGRLVRLFLDPLPRRRLECPLDLGRGLQRDDVDGYQLQSQVAEQRRLPQTVLDGRTHGTVSAHHQLA